MRFNRVAGIYLGSTLWKMGFEAMSIDDQNSTANEVLANRLDQLSAAFDHIEAGLRAMRIPVDTDIKYESWPVDPPNYGCERHAHIGMIKIQGQWRLCHGYSDDSNPDVAEWKPIRETPIYVRLAVAPHLEKLKQEIVRQKERVIPKIEAAIAQLSRVSESMDDAL